MPEITASFETLLKQASMTASDYLANAVDQIDRTFGDGYAAEHPTLVAAFMKVTSDDFRTSSTLKVIEQIVERLVAEAQS